MSIWPSHSSLIVADLVGRLKGPDSWFIQRRQRQPGETRQCVCVPVAGLVSRWRSSFFCFLFNRDFRSRREKKNSLWWNNKVLLCNWTGWRKSEGFHHRFLCNADETRVLQTDFVTAEWQHASKKKQNWCLRSHEVVQWWTTAAVWFRGNNWTNILFVALNFNFGFWNWNVSRNILLVCAAFVQGLFKATRDQKQSGKCLCILRCSQKEKRQHLNQLLKLYLHCKWFVEIAQFVLFFSPV